MAGARPSSEQLKLGLPIFYKQLVTILKSQAAVFSEDEAHITENDKAAMKKTEYEDNESARVAATQSDEAVLALDAGAHGKELF